MTRHSTRQAGSFQALILGVILIAFAAAFYRVAQHPAPVGFQVPEVAAQPGSGKVEFRSHFISSRHNIHVHAASLVELGDGRIRAFWFEGSREGAPDVEVRTAVYDPAKNIWGDASSVANREGTQKGLLRYVKKLGNPVAARAGDGTLWLFYVTVSLGGWAGSSITAITSKDDGVTWSPPRRLVTSPFINISTLVKGTPYFYADGSIGLPVYHEFIGKFGELLRIDNDGNLIDKQRLSSGKTTLQPAMLIQSPQQATALMRYSGPPPGRVIATATTDGGLHWSAPASTELPNPNAAVSGVVLPDGRMLLVLNDIEAGRDALSLAVSDDGGITWKKVFMLEDRRGQGADPASFAQLAAQSARATMPDVAKAEAYAESARRIKCAADGCAFEFSYPYLIQTRSGDFHLVYTWNRSYIKHVTFTRAWLDQRLKELSDAKLH